MNRGFTKADLKPGDVIKFRGGLVGMVIGVPNMIVTQNGCYNLKFTNDDLTNRCGYEDYDIVEVRHPRTKSEYQFNIIKYQYGDLVYERKEAEEITLEEVCKLLGKEIKIVK